MISLRSFLIQYIQLSLEPELFYKTTENYINSFSKDGKKLNPDFDLLTELYGVIIGQKSIDMEQQEERENQNLILIDINLKFQEKYVSESLLYNTKNLSYIKTRSFSEHFVNDWIKTVGIQNISKEAVQQLQEEVRVQVRSQCLYKTLLKKHASTLLNFSTIQIPSEVRQYLIPIDISLKNEEGEIVYQDYFEWDILNQLNNVEEFCQQLVEDAQLDSQFYSQLCFKIRTAINNELEWKFMLLVKTFKPIHKDRQSPKLNTQTTQIIKKSLPYAMDISMQPEDKSYKIPHSLSFANSDLFSMFVRNFDILPEEFQEFVNETSSYHQKKEAAEAKQKQQLSDLSNREKVIQALNKNGIKAENNPYLSGISGQQSNNLWKKLIEENEVQTDKRAQMI